MKRFKQSRRNAKAAKRFFRKLLKGLRYAPRVLVTDQLRPATGSLTAQRFLSAFSGISAHFRPRRHLLSATRWRTEIAERFAVWGEVTALDAAA